MGGGGGSWQCLSASISLGAPSPCHPTLSSLCREQLGWGTSPKSLQNQGSWREDQHALGPAGSLLTVLCVEEQLHLLPQWPDHITVAVCKAKGTLLGLPADSSTPPLSSCPSSAGTENGLELGPWNGEGQGWWWQVTYFLGNCTPRQGHAIPGLKYLLMKSGLECHQA